MDYKISDASRERWLSVARDCPYATFFHTPYWYDIIANGQGHIIKEVTFEDGASAIIPIAKIKRFGGIVVDWFSSPAGTYGGWISASSLDEEHVRILAGILASQKNLTCRINHLDKSALEIVPSIYPLFIKEDHTHVVDLTNSESELYNRISRGHKSAISHALHSNVVIKIAETENEWSAYHDLYTASLDRWQRRGLSTRTVYPRALFSLAYEHRAHGATLWLATIDDVPVSGAVYFYFGGHAVYWHGAASSRGFDAKSNHLLHYEIIKDAKRRGYKTLDFNPSGGYNGVEIFKERFGAVRVGAPLLVVRSRGRVLLKKIFGDRGHRVYRGIA